MIFHFISFRLLWIWWICMAKKKRQMKSTNATSLIWIIWIWCRHYRELNCFFSFSLFFSFLFHSTAHNALLFRSRRFFFEKESWTDEKIAKAYTRLNWIKICDEFLKVYFYRRQTRIRRPRGNVAYLLEWVFEEIFLLLSLSRSPSFQYVLELCAIENCFYVTIHRNKISLNVWFGISFSYVVKYI